MVLDITEQALAVKDFHNLSRMKPILRFYLHRQKNANGSKFGLFSVSLAIYAMILLSGNIEDFKICRKRSAQSEDLTHDLKIMKPKLYH